MAKLARTKKHDLPVSLSFATRVHPLCESYEKVTQCFSLAPRPFGEKESVSAFIDGDRNDREVFADFLNSLEAAAEAAGVLE